MRGVVSHVFTSGAFDVYVQSEDVTTFVGAAMARKLGLVEAGAVVELRLADDGAVLSIGLPNERPRPQPVAERRAV